MVRSWTSPCGRGALFQASPPRRSHHGGPRTHISHPTPEHLCFSPQDQEEGIGKKMICNAPDENAASVIQTQINGGKGNSP